MRNRLADVSNTIALDLLVSCEELSSVPVNGEAWDDPDHKAKKLHNGTDVVEDGPRSFDQQVFDDEPSGFS